MEHTRRAASAAAAPPHGAQRSASGAVVHNQPTHHARAALAGPSGRAREPKAPASGELWAAHNRRASDDQRQCAGRTSTENGQAASSPATHVRRASPKKSPVVCTNNKNDPRLREHGAKLGTRRQCLRRGFGAGLYSKPENVEEFIWKHSVPYEKIVTQKLWFKDSEDVPPGYQLATLPQAFQRGYGAGQAKLARKLLAERQASHHGRAS